MSAHSSSSSSSGSGIRFIKPANPSVSSSSSMNTTAHNVGLPDDMMQSYLSFMPFRDCTTTSLVSKSWRLNTCEVTHEQLFESFEKFVAFLKLHFLDEPSQNNLQTLSEIIKKRKKSSPCFNCTETSVSTLLAPLSLQTDFFTLRNHCIVALQGCTCRDLATLHTLNQIKQYSLPILKVIVNIAICCKQIDEITKNTTMSHPINEVMKIIETLLTLKCPDLAMNAIHQVAITVQMSGVPDYDSYACLKQLFQRSLCSGPEIVTQTSLAYMSQVLVLEDLEKYPWLIDALRYMLCHLMNQGDQGDIQKTCAFIRTCHPKAQDFGFSVVASALIEQGKINEAFQFFESIPKESFGLMFDDTMRVLARLVGCFVSQGRIDMAMRSFALMPLDRLWFQKKPYPYKIALKNILEYFVKNNEVEKAIAFLRSCPPVTKNYSGEDIGFSTLHDFGFSVIVNMLIEQEKLDQALDIFRGMPDQIILWTKSRYYSDSIEALRILAQSRYRKGGLDAALEVLKLVHTSLHTESVQSIHILGIILRCLVKDDKVEMAFKILFEYPEEMNDWGLANMAQGMIEHDPDKGLVMLDSISPLSTSPGRRKLSPENIRYGKLVIQLSNAYVTRGDFEKAIMIICKIVPSDYRDLCCTTFIDEAIRQGRIKEAFDILALIQNTSVYQQLDTIKIVMAALELGDIRASLAKYYVGSFSSRVKNVVSCQGFYCGIVEELVNKGQEEVVLYIVERMSDVHYIALSLLTLAKALLRKGNVERAFTVAKGIPEGVQIEFIPPTRNLGLRASILSTWESPLCLRQQMFKELAIEYFSLERMDEFAFCLSMISHEEERKKLLSFLEKLPQAKKAT